MGEVISKLFDFNPRTKDGLINATGLLVCIIYFLYLYFFVVGNIALSDKGVWVICLLVALPALTSVLIFAGDHLAYGGSSESQFFRNEFPSSHIQTKWSVNWSRSMNLWFHAVDRLQRENDHRIALTYEIGYICRFIFYVKRVSLAFLILATATFVGESVWLAHKSPLLSGWKGFAVAFTATPYAEGKFLYIIHVAVLWGYLAYAHKANDLNPTGIWRAWRNVNERNRGWIDEFENEDQLAFFGELEPAAAPGTAASH
jgi:hypothetical protein